MAFEELQNGRYRRLRLLGTGGMGEVYLMDDMRVSRQVAIKVIRAEGAPYPGSDSGKDAARLFQREARAIAALEHPNILPLHDFGEENLNNTTLTYMVMSYCPEGSLAAWIRQRGGSTTLSLQDIAFLVAQAAEGLQYAHDHNVIHLDVKPPNLLLRSNQKNPNRPHLLLADFGVAKMNATTSGSSQTVRGTPASMAPEQWSGVDVPGEALRNVIITRLPFAVPDHPLIEAKLENIEACGGDAFTEYSLPEAILKLRQGVGRLIRTKGDHGIIVILDNRIVTKPYGRAFMSALPKCPVEVL